MKVPKFTMILMSLFLCESVFAQTSAQQNESDEQIQEVKEKAPEVSKIQQYFEPFYYDRTKVRDPFETQSKAGPLEPGQVYGPFLPVQNYRLNEFKLKGLMWNTDKPMAVFEDPKGIKYKLTIKDYIGENFGYIAMIREKEVVVIQTIEEENKRYSTTKIVFLDDNKTKE